MRTTGAVSAVLLLVVLLGGCAQATYMVYIPSASTLSRIHPLGMTVYDSGGLPLREHEWPSLFSVMDDAYTSLRECIGTGDESIWEEVRRVPIVIVPAARSSPEEFPEEAGIMFYRWRHQERWRFGPLLILVRGSAIAAPSFRAEWIHAFLYFSGEGHKANFLLHQSPLFKKCEY